MPSVTIQESGKVLVKSSNSSATAGQVGEAIALSNEAISRRASTIFKDLGVSSDSSASMQSKVSGTTGMLLSGEYRIETSFSYSTDYDNSDFVADLIIDGASIETSTYDFFRVEPKVSGQHLSFSRIDYADFLTDSTHTIDLQWMSTVIGLNASIWSASVVITRAD